MNAFFQRLRALRARFFTKRVAIAGGVIVIFLLVAATRAFFAEVGNETATPVVRAVTVQPVAALNADGILVETTGEVRSRTQGDLRAQRAGVVTAVYAEVGDAVSAGSVIATIENAAERASVAQARAGVSQAQASLDKVTGGTREEQLAVLAAQTRSAQQSYDEARTAAVNTLLSAFATTNATLAGGVDVTFDGADAANPEFKVQTTNGAVVNAIEHERFLLQGVIDRHEVATERISMYSGDQLITEMDRVENDLRRIKTFLDDVIRALDGGVVTADVSESTLASYKSTAESARGSTLSTLSSLSSSRGALKSAEEALTVAKENEKEGVSGAQKEDVASARAQLEQAEANLAAAAAQLENTRIRTPVSGTLTTLSIQVGDFVGSFDAVGVVANESALEIKAFVSPQVATQLRVGDSARVADTYDAVVVSIASGLDSATRQIEVRAALRDPNASLVHGTRERIAFLATDDEASRENDGEPLHIPISALKLRGSEAFVFTVSSENTLVPHPVELGAVTRTSVEIRAGLSPDMEIVVDARGLNEGDPVEIARSGQE